MSASYIAPRWAMSTVRPENTPLLGILQRQLAAANNSSRAFSQASRQHIDQDTVASEGLYTQEDQLWDNWDTRHVPWIQEAAEGHVPDGQGLIKCGSVEKGMASQFSIPALKTP